MLPNFLIIGAEKAATTWLYARLRTHPDIFLPGTKEIHYFNRYDSNLQERNHFDRLDLDWYERFFRDHDGESAVGEATPMYLCDPDAPDRIAATLPDVRLLASLRNPVDRAYSHYWMALRKNHVQASFEEIVRRRDSRIIERGRYADQVERYLDRFGEDALCIVLLDDVKASSVCVLTRICQFLDVNADLAPQIASDERENTQKAFKSPWFYNLIGRWTRRFRRTRLLSPLVDAAKKTGISEAILRANRRPATYPDMDNEVRAELTAYYEDDIRRLESILGRSIDSWL